MKVKHGVQAVGVGALVGGLEAAEHLDYGSADTTTLVVSVIAAVLVYVHQRFGGNS